MRFSTPPQPALADASGAREFRMPPVLLTSDGRTRRVGAEIEFSGLTAEEAAHALAAGLGGEVRERDAHAFLIEGSALGDVLVELDLRYAHPDSARVLLGSVGEALAPWIGVAASFLVPCELVAVAPIDRLQDFDRAVAILRAAGGRGTQDSAVYAFGLHFNPEIPDLEARTIASYLKAFALVDPWLRRAVAPDRTRRFLGFADPFPDDYVRLLVSPSYWPDLDALVDDYLARNATRNRDLDALPVLAFLREDRIRAVLPTEKIRPRPTLHYRLPDARVSDPEWSIAADWNRWVVVERLAADRARLDALGDAYLAFAGDVEGWADRIEETAVP